MIQLPRVLKMFNLYMDGASYAGRCDEATPPALALVMEDHRAAGMDMPEKLDLGMEAMTLTAIVSDMAPEMMRLFSIPDKVFVLRKAFQAQGQAVEPVAITTRGMVSRIELAATKPGAKSTHTVTIELNAFKYRQKEIDHIEIDVRNGVRRIGDVDLLAAQRSAVGL